MQDFGGDSRKPTWLYSNYDILDGLDKFKSGPGPMYGHTPLVEYSTNRDGKKCYQGTSSLKHSQEYPKEFGLAVRKLILKNERKIRARKASLIRLSSAPVCPIGRDKWDDAELSSVIAYLSGDKGKSN